MPRPSAVGGATSPSGPPASSSGLGSRPSVASMLRPWAHPRVRLRPPPILSQVRWLLEPNDTVRVQVNNQTVTFETQHEGRLGTAVSSPASSGRAWGGLGGHPPREPRLTPPPLAASRQLLHPGQASGLPAAPHPREEGVSCGLGSGPLGKASPGPRPPSGPRSLAPPLPLPPQVLGRGVPAPGSPSVSPRPGRETFNSTGVTVTRAGSVVSAAFDGAVAVSVRALSNILHASCGLPAEYRGRTEGLLGEKLAPPCPGRRGRDLSASL